MNTLSNHPTFSHCVRNLLCTATIFFFIFWGFVFFFCTAIFFLGASTYSVWLGVVGAMGGGYLAVARFQKESHPRFG